MKMKHAFQTLGVLSLVVGLAACSNDNAPTTPSPANGAVMFTATLSPANEVPPVTGSDAGGSATATVTFNLTKDSAGYITAASLDVSVTAKGFPAPTTLTNAHIHNGAAGANGGVYVDFGLSGNDTLPSGTGTLSKTGIALTVDQANSILANPSGFYLNIHTANNPGGAARGQLARAQ
jgi:CHRD domain-containing protein